MLNATQLSAALERVAYRSGWTFTVEMDPFEGLGITMMVESIDSDGTTFSPKTLKITSYLSPNDLASEEAVFQWLLWRVWRAESHEAREFFKVDGQTYVDPGHA